jgi:hypothetical protein
LFFLPILAPIVYARSHLIPTAQDIPYMRRLLHIVGGSAVCPERVYLPAYIASGQLKTASVLIAVPFLRRGGSPHPPAISLPFIVSCTYSFSFAVGASFGRQLVFSAYFSADSILLHVSHSDSSRHPLYAAPLTYCWGALNRYTRPPIPPPVSSKLPVYSSRFLFYCRGGSPHPPAISLPFIALSA